MRAKVNDALTDINAGLLAIEAIAAGNAHELFPQDDILAAIVYVLRAIRADADKIELLVNGRAAE